MRDLTLKSATLEQVFLQLTGPGAARMIMILAVAKNRLMNLRRDRAAFVLAFVLPVAFFTIFAAIFARLGSGRRRARSPSSSWTRTAATARAGSSRACRPRPASSVGLKPGDENDPAGPLYTAATAEAAVRKGEVPSP